MSHDLLISFKTGSKVSTRSITKSHLSPKKIEFDILNLYSWMSFFPPSQLIFCRGCLKGSRQGWPCKSSFFFHRQYWWQLMLNDHLRITVASKTWSQKKPTKTLHGLSIFQPCRAKDWDSSFSSSESTAFFWILIGFFVNIWICDVNHLCGASIVWNYLKVCVFHKSLVFLLMYVPMIEIYVESGLLLDTQVKHVIHFV